MYCITDEQVEYILSDIRRNGVETEDLQLNLLDHICCILEQDLKETDDFERFYRSTVRTFYKKELREIEEETINLLTYKNYYAMKKIMIVSGTMTVAGFIAGSILKIMHLPGAALLLIGAMLLLSFIFLPLMVLLKLRDTNNARDKFILGIGALTGALYCMSTLFAVNHWTGRTELWITTISLSAFILIPTVFFTGIRNAETRVNTIVTTILLVATTGLLFTMIDLRPGIVQENKTYAYVKNEEILKSMQHKLTPKIADNILGTDVNTLCEKFKASLLKQATRKEATGQRNTIIEEQGLDFYDEGTHKILADITMAVCKYNASQNDPANRVGTENTILDMEPDHLNRCTNIYVLNSITQLQILLVVAESNAARTEVAVNK